MRFLVTPVVGSFLRWGRVLAKGAAIAVMLLSGVAQAQPSGGYWKLKGEPKFLGRDGGSSGWIWKVDAHSPGNIAVTDSCCGDTTLSVRAEWGVPPKVLRVGEVPPFRLGAAFQGIVNPRGFSIPAEVSCFFKFPSGQSGPSWALPLPMEAGKQVHGVNTTLKVPGGGERISLIFRLFFSTSYDSEFVYEWVNGSPANPTSDATPAPDSGWLQGDLPPVKKVKSAARFSGMHGQVEVLRAGADPINGWKIAELDDVLNVEDRIKTTEDADCILSFADMSFFNMKAESEIVIIAPPEGKDSKFALVAGNIWVNVKKMLKDGSMEIDLNQAVCGIKGTTFTCSTTRHASTLKVIEGVVAFRAKATGETRMVGAGETVTATASGLSATAGVGMAAASGTPAAGASSGGYGRGPRASAASASATLANLALRKPARQSSTTGGDAQRAVDGNRDGNYGGNSVTHTANNPGEWWEVDLGRGQLIKEIDLWNRTDCCGERLANFSVLVSEQPFASTNLDRLLEDASVWSYRHEGVAGTQTKVPVGVPGRFVRIQMHGANYLCLAEVEVLGEARSGASGGYGGGSRAATVTIAAPISTPSANLALRKPARQSSTTGGDAQRAVDGNRDGNYGANSVTHTGNSPGEWWEVDLGRGQAIKEILLWNRTDCCGERLSNFSVLVSERPFASNSLDRLLEDPAVWSFRHDGVAGIQTQVPVGVAGRFVRIQLHGASNLSLAEVEVLGP